MLLAPSKRLWEIAKPQFKLVLLANFILALILLLLTPVIFGMKYLDSYGSSFVLERFAALSGVILLTPLFLPEQDENVAELVKARYTSQEVIIFVRLFFSLVFLFIGVAAIVFGMQVSQCEFPTLRFLAGTYVTACFLGSLGFALSAVTNNIVAGYLAALCYYLLNFSLGSKLGNFYLFSLATDNMGPKYYLAGASMLLILLGFMWRYLVARFK